MDRKRPRYIWHHDLHSRLCNERLFYLRLAFRPIYDREKALEQIKSVFQRLNVSSYTMWELFGDSDLLIRLWLPPGLDMGRLKKDLDTTIVGGHHASIHVFATEGCIHHWMWGGSPNILAAKHRIAPADFAGLNGARKTPKATLEEYETNNFVHQLKSSRRMKFFVWVNVEQDGHMAYEENDFEKALAKISQRPEHFSEVSLYEGNGFANYLLTGRMPPSSWEVLSDELTEGINYVGRKLGVRTITSISAFASPIDQREQLALVGLSMPGAEETEESPDIDILLAEGETRTIEVKSSAFVDVSASAMNGTLHESPAITDSLARAVLALLNTVGGFVLVGLGERPMIDLDAVRSMFNPLHIGGDFAVLGTRMEWPKRKATADSYISRVKQALASRIDPIPRDLLDYRLVAYKDREVLIIRITRPEEWFFSKSGEFYVREANGTASLSGQEMLKYMGRNRRGDS